jgi:hypothetical protein
MTCVSGQSLADIAEPSHQALSEAVTQYLKDHGDLCVGKPTWPRDLTAEQRQSNSNDAIQLPVLEHLGLVESKQIPASVAGGAATVPAQSSQPAASTEAVTRYSLTAKGQQYFLHKKRTVLGIHGQSLEQDADLCVASLSLDKVVKWSPPEQVKGHLQTIAQYTYHIKSADWMDDQEARKVFPVAARIIHGQGNLLMSVPVQLQDGKWLAVLPTQ